ncbi:hypothetical protein Tco_1242490 [Tanacetum coccineum]
MRSSGRGKKSKIENVKMKKKLFIVAPRKSTVTKSGATRSWYVEGHIRSGVISFVLMQRYQRTIRQRLEEEKARRRGKVFNWETAKYGKIWYDEDVHDLRSVETEFPAIVFNDTLTSEAALSCEPIVSIRRILGYGYGVSTSCTVLGPRERNIDEVGGMHIFWNSMCVLFVLGFRRFFST